MKPVFGLFESYADAQAATGELLERGFGEGEMNAIIQKEAAKSSLEVNLERVNVEVTEAIGEKTIHGLDRLIGSQQPVRISDVGEVYAGGEVATILTGTASIQGAAASGLKAALIDLGMPDQVAEACRAGIESGGVLLWIRTSDDRVAEAANVLSSHKGSYVSSYTR